MTERPSASIRVGEWRDYYGDVKEIKPMNAPPPRGKSVRVTMFVDADFAGDKITRRSRTGILLFVNRAPVSWLSKKQPTIQTATFGAEFTALRTGTEMIKGLRYKLRMLGVPIEGPAITYCDNMSVVNNTTRPESVLMKKSTSVNYHYVRECVAAGIQEINFVRTNDNLADCLTKTQTGLQRRAIVSRFMYE